MLTLALSQVFYYAVLMWTPVTGGTDGLGNLPLLFLSAPLGGRSPVQASARPLLHGGRRASSWPCWSSAASAALAATGGSCGRSRPTRRGRPGVRLQHPRVKLVAFALSGLFSGLAGGLLTVILEFVPIENIYWSMSGTVLIMTLFGGTGTLLGSVRGRRRLHLDARLSSASSSSTGRSSSGAAFVLIVLFMPEGIVGTLPAPRGASGPAAIARRPTVTTLESPAGWSAPRPRPEPRTAALRCWRAGA